MKHIQNLSSWPIMDKVLKFLIEGYKVKIPAIFVNHADGDKLVKTIEDIKNRGEKLIVKVYFENQKTDKVELKLYLESSNFISYFQTTEDHINLSMIFKNFIKRSVLPSILRLYIILNSVLFVQNKIVTLGKNIAATSIRKIKELLEKTFLINK